MPNVAYRRVVYIPCVLAEILSHTLIQRDLLIYIENNNYCSVDPGIHNMLTKAVKYTGAG